MKLSIPPIGQVIRKGHSLELAIMSPSHIGQPNWGFSILDLPGRNTVYHSEQYPSSLTLSVLPGVTAPAAPPCGSWNGSRAGKRRGRRHRRHGADAATSGWPSVGCRPTPVAGIGRGHQFRTDA